MEVVVAEAWAGSPRRVVELLHLDGQGVADLEYLTAAARHDTLSATAPCETISATSARQRGIWPTCVRRLLVEVQSVLQDTSTWVIDRCLLLQATSKIGIG